MQNANQCCWDSKRQVGHNTRRLIRKARRRLHLLPETVRGNVSIGEFAGDGQVEVIVFKRSDLPTYPWDVAWACEPFAVFHDDLLNFPTPTLIGRLLVLA